MFQGGSHVRDAPRMYVQAGGMKKTAEVEQVVKKIAHENG
jgi:hypothetical protein